MGTRTTPRSTRLVSLSIILLVALFSACSEEEHRDEAREPEPPRYQESPILRDRVERGQLPPVEERLPAEPLVVEPLDSIGTYDSEFLDDLAQDEE